MRVGGYYIQVDLFEFIDCRERALGVKGLGNGASAAGQGKDKDHEQDKASHELTFIFQYNANTNLTIKNTFIKKKLLTLVCKTIGGSFRAVAAPPILTGHGNRGTEICAQSATHTLIS